jgi:hypothetical protein
LHRNKSELEILRHFSFFYKSITHPNHHPPTTTHPPTHPPRQTFKANREVGSWFSACNHATSKKMKDDPPPSKKTNLKKTEDDLRKERKKENNLKKNLKFKKWKTTSITTFSKSTLFDCGIIVK